MMLNILRPQFSIRATITSWARHVRSNGNIQAQEAIAGVASNHEVVQSTPLTPVTQNPATQSAMVAHVIPASFGTPLEWFKSLPRDMSLVIYIDQPTTQIMEMLAVSRRQAADLFRVPMYAGNATDWQKLGQFRLRRTDFSPALAFQQQEDALNELEGLLSARWYNSTELSTLDQSILLALNAPCIPEDALVADHPVATNANPQLRELLQSRAVMSEEAKRIDERLISAFQQIGVALPDPLPEPG